MKKHSNIKYIDDADEQKVMDLLEKGSYKLADKQAEKIEHYQALMRQSQKKTKNINVRVSASDHFLLKSRAQEAGMPYQTMLGTLIHKFVKGKIQVQL